MEIKRMQIWFAKDNTSEIMPGIQAGDRPFLVTSNDIGNKLCNIGKNVSVIGIWGSRVLKQEFNNMRTKVVLGAECGLKNITEFSAEQPKTLNISQLKFYIGQVPENKIVLVDNAIAIANGLKLPFSLDYIKELIDDIIIIDKLTRVKLDTEEDYRRKVRRIKEIQRYCADYGYNYQSYMDELYYKRGAMCG